MPSIFCSVITRTTLMAKSGVMFWMDTKPAAAIYRHQVYMKDISGHIKRVILQNFTIHSAQCISKVSS